MLTAAQEMGLTEEWHLGFLCGDQGKKNVLFGLNQVSHSPGWLKHIKYRRISLNFSSSCLYLPSARITSVHHHSWFVQCWGSNLGFVHASQSLSQSSKSLDLKCSLFLDP